MNLAGNTKILVCGANGSKIETRILSHAFNSQLKKTGGKMDVYDADGFLIVPSKGAGWDVVAQGIREGKKIQAKVQK